MVNVPPENKQSKFMKNSKKFYKNSKPGRPPYFQQSADEMLSSDQHGENSMVVETSAPPAIAIVAPTARNPPTLVTTTVAPCKAHMSAPPPPLPRTMHVQ